MNTSDLQSIRYLVKRELDDLELARTLLRNQCRKLWPLAIPDTEDGKFAFEDLNYARSQLRTVNQRLRKMRGLTYSIKAEMLDKRDRARYALVE